MTRSDSGAGPVSSCGKRSRRLLGILLAMPTASVSALAWVSSNPFNGTLVAILAAILAVLSLQLPAGAVRTGPVPATVVGALLLAFGWIYPHFLDSGSFYGVFGALRLGVALDWVLVAGAATLFLYAVARKTEHVSQTARG